MRRLLLVSLSVVALALNAGAADAQRPPDIVVYLSDDLSAADLPLYGGANIKTPAIDQLAAAGLGSPKLNGADNNPAHVLQPAG